MDNGHDGELAEKVSGLRLNDSSQSPNNNNNDSLFQVMKAVEAAEATIKQQVEENNHLRSELTKKLQELEVYKLESVSRRPDFGDHIQRLNGPYGVYRSVPGVSNQVDRSKNTGDTSSNNTPDLLVADQRLLSNNEVSAGQTFAESHSQGGALSGPLKGPVNNVNFSEFSSPSALEPHHMRYQIEGERDLRFGHGLMRPMAEVNNPNSLWKQDLIHKNQEHEEEILQLRKHLADYSIKEAQIRNEKYVLEKRIAYMRLAFDQQQQDLVDAANKALAYRQAIMEENIGLTYALQVAQQERSIFVSYLLPLLGEYQLQPAVPDAQSIVSNVKVLFRHLQEKLLVTESKLKESQYQVMPWNSDANNSNIAPPSPSYSVGAGLTTSNINALVPQPMYSQNIPTASSDGQLAPDWDPPRQQRGGLDGIVGKSSDTTELERYSPHAIRNSAIQENHRQVGGNAQGDYGLRYTEETNNKQVTFRNPVSHSELDDQDERRQNTPEPWISGGYTATMDDPGSPYPPYLPPVLEEPSSSFSEGADDDPLPAIEGLQISGEAFPGRELQACGYSINGTTSCNFEWVRHLEDGSVNYIDGAKQPNYLITADDVDTYLAIEVQPLDDRKRKGELVKVFANEHRKITCDPEMQNCIEKTLYSGHTSYKISLSTGYLAIWELATLSIKREGYSIKCSGPSGTVVTEKFSSSTNVSIPFGQLTEFVIVDSDGSEHLLRADENPTDVSCSRDAIVLTLRLFILKAIERKKVKKKSFLFK